MIDFVFNIFIDYSFETLMSDMLVTVYFNAQTFVNQTNCNLKIQKKIRLI